MGSPADINLSLSEFVYTVSRQMPVSVKRHLPERYYRKILTDKAAKKFAATASFEQKKELLCYLGVEYFTVFADTRSMASEDIRDALKNHEGVEETPATTLKKMAEKNLFISGSRSFCFQLLHHSMITDKPVYRKALEVVRSSYHMAKWGSKLNNPVYRQTVDEAKSLQAFSSFMLQILKANLFCKSLTEVDSLTLMMLMFLHENGGYVSRENITSEFSFSNRQAGVSIKKCLELMYIQKHPLKSKCEYMITSRGVLAVNSFIGKVAKSLDF